MKKTMTVMKQYFVLFYIVSAILIVAGIVLGFVLNKNDGPQTITATGTVINVKEQLDTEEQVNAIVSVTKYHLVVDCMIPDVGEKMVTAEEAYSTKEFASGKIGEERTLTLDATNYSEVAKQKINLWFLAPLLVGLAGAGTTFVLNRKRIDFEKNVRAIRSINKVDI